MIKNAASVYYHKVSKYEAILKIGEGTYGERYLWVTRTKNTKSRNVNKISNYEVIKKIGEDAYGEVYKAKNRSTGEIVAVKKVLTENKEIGFPVSSLREIKALKALKHRNIVNLIEVCDDIKENAADDFNYATYLVFDFCEHDLHGLLENPNVEFSLGEKKMLMQHLFSAVSFLHRNSYLHRDIKSANILLTQHGIVKLADFGLSRSIVKEGDKKYTDTVATLWYRPPEVLLIDKNYGPAIDIWSLGCVMAELWTRTPLLPGSSEIHQLKLITQLCGNINPEKWPGVTDLLLYNKIKMPQSSRRKLQSKLLRTVRDRFAIQLLDRMLTLNPKERIDADSALKHAFFTTFPEPCDIKLSQHKKSMFSYFLPSNRHGYKTQANNQMENTPLLDEDS